MLIIKLARISAVATITIIVAGLGVGRLRVSQYTACTTGLLIVAVGALMALLCIVLSHAAQAMQLGKSVRKPMLATLLVAYPAGLFAAYYIIPVPDAGCGGRIGWNESSAHRSIRVIVGAEQRYKEAYPTIGYSCALRHLGSPPESVAPGPSAAGLLGEDNILADGIKSGYYFAVSCTTYPPFFRVVGWPVQPGVTGVDTYCTDDAGAILHVRGTSDDCFKQGLRDPFQ